MLEVIEVFKRFAPDSRVVNGVSLTVREGAVGCLLGPSGCGKTTLLRIIAGLEVPDAGRVCFAGVDMTDAPVHRRHFGLMFQDYALFPHLTVGENIAFGLRMAAQKPAEVAARVNEMLELVNLNGYMDRVVDGLSGGEQQRVALARTLAPSPRLVLLDEPLANLDRLLREELADDLHKILKRIGVTTVFVTHDQQEAFALADQVMVMNRGRVEQEGTPQDVYRHPANSFVAGFLGLHNLVPAAPSATDRQVVHTPLGDFRLSNTRTTPPAAGAYRLLLRPDAALLHQSAVANSGRLPISGRVVSTSFRGSVLRIQMAPQADRGLLLTFDLPAGDERQPKPGEDVTIVLDPAGMELIADTD